MPASARALRSPGLFCLARRRGRRSAPAAVAAARRAGPGAGGARRLGAAQPGVDGRRPRRPPRPRQRAPTRGTAGLVVCYGILGFGYILPATFLPVLARSVVDDPRLFGLAWPVFGATAALSTLMAGWWMRRATRLQVWAAARC